MFFYFPEMKVFQIIVTLFLVLTCVLARRPHRPGRPPKGPPPPPIGPPIGPGGPPVGPPTGIPGGVGGGSGNCFVGQADASACPTYNSPDTSVSF